MTSNVSFSFDIGILGVLNVRTEKIFLALFLETSRRKKAFMKRNKIPKSIKLIYTLFYEENEYKFKKKRLIYCFSNISWDNN